MVTGSMLLVIFVVAIALLLLAIIKFKISRFLALLAIVKHFELLADQEVRKGES